MATSEIRDDVELTNLDQPLFDGGDATKRDLVDYLDAVADEHHPRADQPTAVSDPGPAWPAAVHAKEPPQVHAALGGQSAAVGRVGEA